VDRTRPFNLMGGDDCAGGHAMTHTPGQGQGGALDTALDGLVRAADIDSDAQAMQMTPPPTGLLLIQSIDSSPAGSRGWKKPPELQLSQHQLASQSSRHQSSQPAGHLSSQQLTQYSQTMPGGAAAGTKPGSMANPPSNPSKKRKQQSSTVPDWVHYDADIIDNMSKTRRFASECLSDDIVSRMSVSADDHEDGTAGQMGRPSMTQSPSPLSKHKYMGVYRMDGGVNEGGENAVLSATGLLSTPVKPKLNELMEHGSAMHCTPIPRKPQSAVPAKLFEAELSVTTSPSDVKMDGGSDLRKTALVRLALRNGRQAHEMNTDA